MDAARLLLVGLLVLVLAGAGLARRARRREAYQPGLPRVDPGALPGLWRAPLTLVFFTSRLCAECRETPRVVREAAPELPIVPLSVHEHGPLARALKVVETPTLLLVDGEGRIRYARAGNPTPEELWTYVREAWDSLEAEGGLVRVPMA